MKRELMLLRHAQANAGAASGRDYDRELSEFGRSQPDPVGRSLAAAGFSAQVVLCSASARTRETLALLQGSGLCTNAQIEYSEALYECSTRQILLELAGVDESVERVLMVGHNPGLSDVATGLSQRSVGLSPGEFAWLSFSGDWHAIDTTSVQLKSM